jgi:transcription elongation factor
MMCESHGDIHAENPSSSASGKWQIVNGTWGNFMGYPTAASAPEWVQDERARQIYAGGAGRHHWVC